MASLNVRAPCLVGGEEVVPIEQMERHMWHAFFCGPELFSYDPLARYDTGYGDCRIAQWVLAAASHSHCIAVLQKFRTSSWNCSIPNDAAHSN